MQAADIVSSLFGGMTAEEAEQALRNIGAIKALMAQPGWKVLCETWAFERENIIARGKASSSEESARCRWARLDGFERAMMTAQKIVDQDRPDDVEDQEDN